MAFSFQLFPPPLPLPSPAAASSYLVSVHHGRRPLEHGCRCGRPPETGPSSTNSSGGVGSYDREAACRPVGLEGGASSSGRQTGSVEPGYQATSTKGETSRGDNDGWQKKQYNIDDFPKSRSKSRYFQAFGVDLSPDNVAVAIVYFVQGVLGLSRLAVSFYLKDEDHLDPAETAVISGFSALPWLVKPLYGFISDSIPLFGYRRRSYLILSGLLGALSWSLMATIVDDNKVQRSPSFLDLLQLPSLML